MWLQLKKIPLKFFIPNHVPGHVMKIVLGEACRTTWLFNGQPCRDDTLDVLQVCFESKPPDEL